MNNENVENNEKVIGTCSICGGPVVVPQIWHSVLRPVPTCKQCGATMREYGPIIDMTPGGKTFTGTGTGDLGGMSLTHPESDRILAEKILACQEKDSGYTTNDLIDLITTHLAKEREALRVAGEALKTAKNTVECASIDIKTGEELPWYK